MLHIINDNIDNSKGSIDENTELLHVYDRELQREYCLSTRMLYIIIFIEIFIFLFLLYVGLLVH